MTDHATLLSLLGEWVTVTHPQAPNRVWHGQLATLMDVPSLTMLLPEGGFEVLPQSFDVVAAGPASGGPHPDTDSQAHSLAQLRDSGLLWLINRVALHPRGLALALHFDEHGQSYGWSLVHNSDGEPWQFDLTTDNDGYVRAERTIADALADLPLPPDAPRCSTCGGGPVAFENDQEQKFCAGCVSCTCGQDTCHLAAPPNAPEDAPDGIRTHPDVDVRTGAAENAAPRLLDCGFCYEEHGEEVHPHPECPIGRPPSALPTHLDREQLVEQSKPDTTVPCCVCGGGPVVYDNYKGQLFCWRCADCDCGRDGPCIRTNLHRQQTWECTGTCREPFHGLARCERHHNLHPDYGTPGPWHEGTSQDGSRLIWKDGEAGATPHRPDAIRTSPDADVRTGGLVRMPVEIGETVPGLTCPDSIRTHLDADTSGRPDASTETMPRAGLRAAVAELMDIPTDLIGFLDGRCSCGQDSPLVFVAPDGGHWHIDPAEHEKLQRGREDMHPAVAAWGQCWDRAENQRIRLALARQVLVDDGHFTDDQIGDDLAPRLVEWMSAHRTRIRELAQTLEAVLSHFPEQEVLEGRDYVRTHNVAVRQIDRWRSTLYRFQALDAIPKYGTDCPNPGCTAVRTDLTAAISAYDIVRANLLAAGKYVQQQMLSGFPLGRGDNRYRALQRVSTWTGDPGELKLTTTVKKEES